MGSACTVRSGQSRADPGAPVDRKICIRIHSANIALFRPCFLVTDHELGHIFGYRPRARPLWLPKTTPGPSPDGSRIGVAGRDGVHLPSLIVLFYQGI